MAEINGRGNQDEKNKDVITDGIEQIRDQIDD
jgi:hypothetical protein